MRVLIKIIAIFFLLRILSGYAQIMPSLSFTRLVEKPKMISAETQTIDIGPVEFIDDQKDITPKQTHSTTKIANLGIKTLAMELEGVNRNGGSFIYEVDSP